MTNVDEHRLAFKRFWFQNTSSGHQNRESHVARRRSVARMGTWGASCKFIYPLRLIHGQPLPWAPNSQREGEREDDSPVSTAPFTCCFEFLETSVTAYSRTHNLFSFMAGGQVTEVTLRAGVLLYVLQEGSIVVPGPYCAVW